MSLRLLLLAALLTGWAGAYTVKKGDTLYSVARAYGLSVEQLQQLNGLTGTTLRIGQELRVSPTGAAAPAAPARLPTVASAPNLLRLTGVSITAPQGIRMGDGFVLRLSGERAGEVTVSFPSELGEDVRRPNEKLSPVKAGDDYLILGRAVLGKTTPVVYEVRLGDEVVKGQIPVRALGQSTQHLNLPPSISKVLQDPAREAEDAAVEQAYARRTPQQWSRPFAAPLAKARPNSSSFGQPRTYVKGGQVAYHYGSDSPAASGTPVLAINDGTVVMAGRYPVRGGLVVIDHGAGVVSLYFHQSKVSARVGQQVTRGQKIGEVGSTGLSSGPHLHLEVRVRGEATNPAGWLGKLWP